MEVVRRVTKSAEAICWPWLTIAPMLIVAASVAVDQIDGCEHAAELVMLIGHGKLRQPLQVVHRLGESLWSPWICSPSTSTACERSASTSP